MKLEVQQFFHAAHQLPDCEDLFTKECARLHGHTYLVKVIIKNQENKRGGMVIDFKAIKNEINILDHRFINDVFKEYEIEQPTTAENIAKFLKHRICKLGFESDNIEIWICEGYKGPESSCWAIE